ncbi:MULTISPECIES: hypothetical protein [unclassified Ensifer]|uniref:hypothetical protein n=1 Tax=unclassified Ensifer TaxID=2633371 RepID=UPI0007160641|nr:MULTISPECIES: hypothetical protein [unclassified Ensifer]KRD56805.1 hypothetical protein ASE71_13795 [Ensifer sp. Root954]
MTVASHKIGISSGRCEVNLRQRQVDLGDNYKYSLPETAIAKVSGGRSRGNGPRDFVRRGIQIQDAVSDRLTDAT